MKVLKERGRLYGDFKTQAEISQQLKGIIFGNNENIKKHPFLSEAVEMLCHKLARIANGNELYIDNFRDLAGFSQLVVDILESGEIEGAVDSVVRYKKVINGEWVFEGERDEKTL